MKRIAFIAGAGPVLGAALVREFTAAGYVPATLRRKAQAADEDVIAVTADLGDPAATTQAIAEVARHGEIDVLVFNPSHFVRAPFAELKPADFEAAWRTTFLGAVACAQAVLPGMLERGRGTLLFSGATASVRGGSGFAAFASAKFALRALAQSLAREYQPRGIHVAHIVLDGILRGSASQARMNVGDERTLDPADVAKAYRALAEQTPSAWTHEIDLRPRTEAF